MRLVTTRLRYLLWGAILPAMLLQAEPLPAVPGLEEDIQVRAGLENSRRKFNDDKTGFVAYVGGSITFAKGWSQQVDAELQRRFPGTQFTFVHAGISSIDSSGHAFRLQKDVLEKGVPDLVFVEAAVNDLHNGRTEPERRRAMEGIVRRLRRANRFVDIVFLHFAEPRHTADYDAGRVPEIIGSHEAVAAHYQVPSVNLAHEVQRRMAAGQFEWKKDFKDLHPSPFGHELYYQAIRRLFDQAWSSPDLAGAKPRAHTLPKPLDPFCYDAGAFVATTQAEDVRGFRFVDKWEPAKKAGTREGFVGVPMFVGEQPGDGFTLRFAGRGIGFFLVAGPDAGVIEYRIDDGPWQQRDTFTQWSPGLYLPWVTMLATDLTSGPHRLEVRLAEQKNAAATGSTLRIRDVLVNGLALELPPLSEIQVRSTLDNTEQPSLVGVPDKARSEPTPLLVYLHSWSGDYRQDNSAWQREAVQRGWIYLHPNFRGINKQPQACGSKFARQDVVDAVDFVASRYQVDPERIYVAGSSGGGHMAMLMASYFPRRFSAVSAWVGISDLAEWYRFHAPDGKEDRYAQMTVDCLGGPPSSDGKDDSAVAAAYRERSPLFHLQHATGLPIDIAAGVQDGHTGSVPIAHSLRAFNVLAQAGGHATIAEAEMQQLWNNGRLSQPQSTDEQPDPSYGRQLFLRRQAGAARVTLFDGGHEGLPAAACEWLASRRHATTAK